MKKEIKYILIPTWSIIKSVCDKSYVKHDIPTFFIKLFNTKKEIEKYLDTNDLESELHKIMLDSVLKNGDKDELKRTFEYRRITFWVVGVNPVGKENRIGVMEKIEEKKWKYIPMMGGKVWKNDLLFGSCY